MARYVARRLLEIIPVILAIVVFNFVLIHIAPGDPAQMMAGEMANQEYIQEVRKTYGLDKPIYVQLALYLSNILRGDLGYSIPRGQPVLYLILEKIPATLFLVVSAQVFSVIFGTMMGVLSARNYGSRKDALICLASLVLYSMPVFWFGLILILVFGVGLHIFPIFGMSTAEQNLTGLAHLGDVAWHAFLPVMTLSLAGLTPMFLRLARSSILEVMKEDFITTARAKGLTENVVFFKHALRNALLPTVTQAGLVLGFVFSGAVMTETVFAWPGLGRFMLDTAFQRDYPLMMGMFLFISVTVVAASLVTDIVYSVLDPRVVYK
jgi:peptide/nickel transport system permease protein